MAAAAAFSCGIIMISCDIMIGQGLMTPFLSGTSCFAYLLCYVVQTVVLLSCCSLRPTRHAAHFFCDFALSMCIAIECGRVLDHSMFSPVQCHPKASALPCHAINTESAIARQSSTGGLIVVE